MTQLPATDSLIRVVYIDNFGVTKLFGQVCEYRLDSMYVEDSDGGMHRVRVWRIMGWEIATDV